MQSKDSPNQTEIGKVQQQEIERLKKRESELLEIIESISSTSQAKSEFIAKLSHDLRTPLHAILSYSKFGMDKIDRVDKEKLIKYFTRISESGRKLQEMLDGLVNLAKLESGRMSFQFYSCKISTIVESLEKKQPVRFLEKGLVLEKRISDSLDAVMCDQNKIAQVIRILFDHAILTSKVDSVIKVTVLEAEDDASRNIQIGISFDREEPFSKEIYSDFYGFTQKEKTQPSPDNFGVNLSIATEIIRHHKGKMWAEKEGENIVSLLFSFPLDL